eukprot:17438-Pelagomonas_calceolata.AAC.1
MAVRACWLAKGGCMAYLRLVFVTSVFRRDSLFSISTPGGNQHQKGKVNVAVPAFECSSAEAKRCLEPDRTILAENVNWER